MNSRGICCLIISVGLSLSFHFGLAQVDSTGAQTIVSTFQSSSPDSLPGHSTKEFIPQWYDMFANIPGDWVRWSELTFTARNIPLFIGLTVSTVALVASDDATWQASDKWYKGSRTIRKASDFFEIFGDGKVQFGLSAAFGLYGFAAKDGRALRTASQTVEVILACGTVVQVIKHMTGRESPLVSTAPGGKWRLFPNQIEYHKHVPHYDAYPSGHVATGLATVVVIAENYPEVGWIRPVGYTLVGLLAIAMGNTGIHWYSDYPLGIALGYSFGMLVAHPEEVSIGETENKSPAKLSFSPTLYQSGGGFRVSLSF
jgi:membrane-associated PAP2 superfamily phosphatase